MPDVTPETSDEFAARVQRAVGRESDAERRYREGRETDAAIQAAQATPDDTAAYHAATLRGLAVTVGGLDPATGLYPAACRAALNSAADYLERVAWAWEDARSTAAHLRAELERAVDSTDIEGPAQ